MVLYRLGVRQWWGGGQRSRRQLIPVIAVLAAVLSLRAVVSLRGYLYADDFAFRYWAATDPLNWDYLTRSYGGHVNPIGLLNQWVLQALFPGSHTALALFTMALWAATLIAAAMLAMLLTSRWQGPAVLLALVGLSLLGFENTTWWAAAIYAGPYQLFAVGGMYCIARWRLQGSSGWLWVAVACAAGASFSFSRGFMAAVLMFLIAATVPYDRDGARGLLRTWLDGWRAWIVMLVISFAAVVVVLSRSADISRSGFSVGGLPRYMWLLLSENILPGIWGGPWRWFELPPPQWDPIVTNPAPSTWAVLFSVVATLLAVAWLWRFRPHLRGLLLTSTLFTAMVLVIAGLARSGTVVESTAYRYTFDILWPVGLLMTLAVVPMRWQSDPVSRGGLVVVAFVCAGALISTGVPAKAWIGNQARTYMANATSSFPRIPAGQAVLDQGVPEDLIHPALMAPYANARTVMTPVPGAPVFSDYAADTLFGFAPDGTVEEQTVEGPSAPPGPDPDCGYRVTDTPRTIPLDGRLIPWDFYARVAYFSGVDTTLNLAVGGRIHTVPLTAGGVRAVFFRVQGPGQDVLVSAGTPGVTVCVTELSIGNRISKRTAQVVPLPVTELAR